MMKQLLKNKYFLGFFVLLSLLAILHLFQSRYDFLYAKDEQPASDKVKLRFASCWGELDPRADTLQNVLGAFMKDNPGIEIVNESTSGENFLLKMKTDFSSGNEPDVFGLWTGADLYSLIKHGKVADLTDLLQQDPKWKENFDKSTWRFVTVDHQIYGLPLEIVYQGLFINKDLFESADVPVPKTFDDLKKAVTAFRSVGVIPIAFNYSSDGAMLYQSIVAMLGGAGGVEDISHAGEKNSCYLKAIDYLKELYDMGAFPENALALDNKSTEELFLDKKAAMIVQRSGFIGEINKRPSVLAQNSEYTDNSGDSEITVDIILFPYIDGGKADPTSIIYGLDSGTFFMSRKAQQDEKTNDAAVRFLKYITSEDVAYLFSEQTRMLSAVKIPPPSVYYSGLMKTGMQLIDSTKEVIPFPDSMVNRLVWDDVVVKQLPYILAGQKDGDSVWRKIMETIHNSD